MQRLRGEADMSDKGTVAGAEEGSGGWMIAGWYGLFVLVLALVLGSVNTSIIALVSESIKGSLSLSDAQIGMLNGLALTLVTAIATVPMGWLADRIDRRVLLTVCVGIWSAATFAFAQSTSFEAMFLFAMGIAVGEAVLGPIVYSMIPDLFPRRMWIVANFVFYVAALVGAYAGFAASGAIIAFVDASQTALPAFMEGMDPWRAALTVVAAIGPLVMLLVLVMQLRRSGTTADGSGGSGGLLQYFRTHARTLAGVFLGFGLTYAAFGAQSRWNAMVLQRIFGEKQADIGLLMGYVGGGAALIGVAAAWAMVRWLRPRHGDFAPMLVAQFGLLVGLLVTLALPFVETGAQYYAVIATKVLFTTMAMSLSPAILQFIAPAHLRGRVIALGGMVTVIFQSFMPFLIGFVSDQYFTGPKALLWSLCVVIIPVLVVGLALLRFGSSSLPATIRAAQGTSG
jgi:MFS family permease